MYAFGIFCVGEYGDYEGNHRFCFVLKYLLTMFLIIYHVMCRATEHIEVKGLWAMRQAHFATKYIADSQVECALACTECNILQ